MTPMQALSKEGDDPTLKLLVTNGVGNGTTKVEDAGTAYSITLAVSVISLWVQLFITSTSTVILEVDGLEIVMLVMPNLTTPPGPKISNPFPDICIELAL